MQINLFLEFFGVDGMPDDIQQLLDWQQNALKHLLLRLPGVYEMFDNFEYFLIEQYQGLPCLVLKSLGNIPGYLIRKIVEVILLGQIVNVGVVDQVILLEELVMIID